MSNYRMHIPAPYVHPIYTDGAIDTPVSNHAPLPVIARDTRLVIANNDTSFVPSLGTSGSSAHTDLFGNTNTIANIGIYSAQAEPNIVIPDPWRIRRFVVLLARTASGATSVEIGVTVYGRLIRADGTPTPWRTVVAANDSAISFAVTIRLVAPTSLSGVFGYDQYRITFRRNPDSDPAPQLSNIRIYAEF